MEVPKQPKRVVVLDYGVLDTLDFLGIRPGVLGIPKQTIPAYLEKYKGDGTRDTGNPKEPDFEAISKLQPELIIVNKRSEAAYDELSKIAPTIDLSVDNADYRASFIQNMKTVGEIFGKEDEAAAEAARISRQMDEVKALGEKSGKGLFLMLTGGKLHAFGKGTRYGLLYDTLALDTVVDPGNGDPSGHGQIITFEYIAEKNPAYILVLDRDAAIGQGGAGRSTMDNALVAGTDAAKNGKIVYLDPGLWYLSGGGLESTKRMLDEIRSVLDQ